MSKRGVFELNIPAAVLLAVFFAGIGASSVYFMWEPSCPQLPEQRIVYVGPAAQIVDTTKTQIESLPDGRLRFERTVTRYNLDRVDRGGAYRLSEITDDGMARGQYGKQEITVYWPTFTRVDTVCYEPCDSIRSK
jgi:hypothetical protein